MQKLPVKYVSMSIFGTLSSAYLHGFLDGKRSFWVTVLTWMAVRVGVTLLASCYHQG